MSPTSLEHEIDYERGSMSTDPPPSAKPPPKAQANTAPSLPIAVRQRLQSVFEHAKKSLEKRDYVYAHDLFSQCVSEDPGTLAYLQHFRANLAQMHPDGGKPTGGFGSLLGKKNSAVGKAANKGDWTNAFVAGCKLLKKSPANTQVLCELAAACGQLGHTESQLYYLRWAMDLAPADAEINRLAALVLEKIAQFDQAIVCWERVLKEKANDEEATRAISRLSVEKTIDHGGYNLELLSTQVADGAPPILRVADLAKKESPEATTDEKPAPPASEKAEATSEQREEQLRAAIDANPTDAATYTGLADFYAETGMLQEAERLYRKGLEVAGGQDIALLEKLEEVYLRRMQERALIAARRTEKQPEAATVKIARQALAEAHQAEVEVYTARADRSPNDPQLKYELGLRLKRVGKHREAIEPFQAAREDKPRLAEVQLHLGECFQQIGQHQLAIRAYEASYEAAINASDKGEWTDLRKLACYRTAVLALGLGDLDLAEKHFTDLAGADFSYRDVGERLDKIARIRNAK